MLGKIGLWAMIGCSVTLSLLGVRYVASQEANIFYLMLMIIGCFGVIIINTAFITQWALPNSEDEK